MDGTMKTEAKSMMDFIRTRKQCCIRLEAIRKKEKRKYFRNRLYHIRFREENFRRFQREELLNRRQRNSWMKILSLKWLCPCRQRRSNW